MNQLVTYGFDVKTHEQILAWAVFRSVNKTFKDDISDADKLGMIDQVKTFEEARDLLVKWELHHVKIDHVLTNTGGTVTIKGTKVNTNDNNDELRKQRNKLKKEYKKKLKTALGEGNNNNNNNNSTNSKPRKCHCYKCPGKTDHWPEECPFLDASVKQALKEQYAAKRAERDKKKAEKNKN